MLPHSGWIPPFRMLEAAAPQGVPGSTFISPGMGRVRPGPQMRVTPRIYRCGVANWPLVPDFA